MDEKKIEEMMALVDGYAATKSESDAWHGSVSMEQKLATSRALVEARLRQLLGEQHG